MKRALITGITGQDGSYLAELLLSKGYEVHGLIRRASTFNTSRIDHLYVDPHQPDARLFLHYGDLTDGTRLVTCLAPSTPTRCTTLRRSRMCASASTNPCTPVTPQAWDRSGCSKPFAFPGWTAAFIRRPRRRCSARLPPPQNEQTPFYPRSPYGAAKVYSYWATRNYREAYGLFAVNGILFNHESPRRGETFVTRKITRAVARIKAGIQSDVYLGNLDAVRDWGYAPEYVEGMWRMLQATEPEDFVLATGRGYTVREFAQTAFDHAGLDWQKHVKFDERYLRPTEVDSLIGDATKAAQSLGWKAAVHTAELARIMVDADIAALECDGKPWIDKPMLPGWS